MLARTADFYSRYLWESAEAAAARDYLAGRGLDEEVLREFAVGFAPAPGTVSWRRRAAGGFSERRAMDAGLAQRARERERVYDRFRGPHHVPA